MAAKSHSAYTVTDFWRNFIDKFGQKSKQTLWLLGCLGIFVLQLQGCATDNQAKLDRANTLLSQAGGGASQRAVALGLYNEIIDNTTDEELLAQAHFGAGLASFLDFAHAIPSVLSALNSGEDSGKALPPITDLVPLIDELLHSLLDDGVVEHFGKIINRDDLSFLFKIDLNSGPECGLCFVGTNRNLSGEWDATEVRLIYGAAQLILAIEESLFLYDGFIDTIITAATSGNGIPPFPDQPKDFLVWFKDFIVQVGFNPLPWLDPNFGVLSASSNLPKLQGRLIASFGAFASGFRFLRLENDNQEDDVFAKNAFLNDVLEKLLPSIAFIGFVVDAFVDLQEFENIFTALQKSTADDQVYFVFPKSLENLLEVALALLYSGPTDLTCLGLPAVSLARFFSQPVFDLKNPNNGIFPLFDSEGNFYVESEQEPWQDLNGNGKRDDNEYNDLGVDGFIDANLDGLPDQDIAERPGADNNEFDETIAIRASDPICLNGRPAGNKKVPQAKLPALAHIAPDGSVQLPNNIVDPLYMYMPDASFSGAFKPLVRAEDGSLIAGQGQYKNGDFIKVISYIFWIVETLRK